MSAPSEPDRQRTQELLMLGEIRGLVQSLVAGQQQTNQRVDDLTKRVDERMDALSDRMDERMDSIDGRLRTVEQKAAVAGAVSGGAMAVGTALILEGIKAWVARGGQ